MKFINCLLFLLLSSLSFGQGTLFWGDQLSGTLNKLEVNTGNVSTLVQNELLIRRVKGDFVNDKVYWTEGVRGSIMSCDFDGSNVTEVIRTSTGIGVLTLDEVNQEIYFTELGIIKKCGYDGSNVQNVITNTGNVQGIEIDHSSNAIFWTEYDNREIKRAMLNGSQIMTILQSANSVFDLTLDTVNNHIYFSDRSANKIQRIDYAGTNLVDIINSNTQALGSVVLSMNKQKLSWLERDSGKILLSDLNGSNITELRNAIPSKLSGHDMYFEKTVGISNPIELIELNLHVFPNPATSIINIEITNFDQNVNLEIYDFKGKLIVGKVITSKTSSIDCTNFSPGVYYFHFKNGDNISLDTRSIIVSE